MKFNCGSGPTLTQRINRWIDRSVERELHWRPWFAWRPVRVAPGDCRWLEWVERRRPFAEFWIYRAMETQP